MKCSCGKELAENEKSWKCGSCGLVIWKEIGRRRITGQTAEKLVKEGQTEVMEFKARDGRAFNAALVLKNGKVEYEFTKGEKGEKSGKVEVRVEAGSSGRCYLSISGPVSKQAEINFGLVSATEAECLALITAAKYVAHHAGAGKSLIKVSLNNLNLSRYILKERVPRDRKMKELVACARKELDRAGKWEVEYRPERRPRLKGGPVADTFPFGVFPWLEAKVRKENGRLIVDLPDDPAVRAQFKASMYSSSVNEDGCYALPETAEKAVYAWVSKTKGSGGNQEKDIKPQHKRKEMP